MPAETPSPPAHRPPPQEAYLDRVVEPEYASISAAAIGALVLAGISVLAFLPVPADLPLPLTVFRFPILLVLPLATLVFAAAAMRGIRRSEGTKIGLGLAQAALILAVVETLGAGALHGARQYHDYSLQQSLVREADVRLGYVLDDQSEPLYQELFRNSPELAKYESELRRLWQDIQAYMHTRGGDYFGRRLQQTHIGWADDPAGGQVEIGVAIFRLRFREGAMDITFRFRLEDGRWQLTDFRPSFGVMDFPDDDETPKKRFDE